MMERMPELVVGIIFCFRSKCLARLWSARKGEDVGCSG